MPHEKAVIPEDLLQLSQRFEEWRKAQQARSRLPESMWAAAAEMAQRHGVHCTTKALRLDYTRLKKRLPIVAVTGQTRSAPPDFLELLASSASRVAECVVEVESSRGRMRVAMKGVTPDWAGLLRAWRETAG
jgi:alkylhydroperoxidase family enzyme